MQLTLTNLGLFETDKEQRKEFVNQVIEGLNEGSVDPLKVHLQVKCMEDIIKQLTSSKEYKEICLTEAVKFGRNFEHHNAKFEIKEMGVKYDYSNCNDPILKEYEKELKAIEEVIKTRQSILKTLPSEGMEIIVEDELVRIYPPSKTSTTTVTVNLK
jgi:hypothetical protein